MNQTTDTTTPALLCGEGGYDPIEDRLRQNIHATIEALFEEELEAVMGRCRYGRNEGSKKGYRHGHRERQLVGTFGTETLSVARADRERCGQDYRMAIAGSAALSAPDQEGRGPDRRGLSGRHEHAAGEESAIRPVSGGGRQGRRQPGLAQGEGRLGCMVRAQRWRLR